MGGPPLERRDLVSSAGIDMGVAMTIAHRATEMRGGDEACGADDEEASRVRTPYRTRPSRPSPWLRWPSRWWVRDRAPRRGCAARAAWRHRRRSLPLLLRHSAYPEDQTLDRFVGEVVPADVSSEERSVGKECVSTC